MIICSVVSVGLARKSAGPESTVSGKTYVRVMHTLYVVKNRLGNGFVSDVFDIRRGDMIRLPRLIFTGERFYRNDQGFLLQLYQVSKTKRTTYKV